MIKATLLACACFTVGVFCYYLGILQDSGCEEIQLKKVIEAIENNYYPNAK